MNGGHLLYALEWTGNDGPWQLPEALGKLNGLLRYSRGTRDNGWSLAAMADKADWNSSDQVPQSAIDSGLISRFGNLDPSDGGKTQRYSLSGEWSERGGNRWARANLYAIDDSLNLWSNFTFCTLGCPLPGDQFEQADRHRGNPSRRHPRLWWKPTSTPITCPTPSRSIPAYRAARAKPGWSACASTSASTARRWPWNSRTAVAIRAWTRRRGKPSPIGTSCQPVAATSRWPPGWSSPSYFP